MRHRGLTSAVCDRRSFFGCQENRGFSVTENLKDFLVPEETALVGRENGENVLKKLAQSGLDFKKLEKECDKITFKIPENVVSINKSFFLGLFETQVQRLGKDGFLNKYKFDTTEHIVNKIKNHVEEYALLNLRTYLT